MVLPSTPAGELRRHRAQVALELDATDAELAGLVNHTHAHGFTVANAAIRVEPFDELLDRRLELMRERDRLAS